ncbi:hypothetical protein [Nocardiopsis suaedae]|uniref:Head-tail adaptor protein n=1 Tax=Nocardiopsis suaedae TaxID=3018444 RepID=A0ABT4TS71_9ACTN|nr:hypothetical protein [Nocardiopsis suaedae]MDA2807540.1 hypothetical protein [Nocardiopsis suaedae]
MRARTEHDGRERRTERTGRWLAVVEESQGRGGRVLPETLEWTYEDRDEAQAAALELARTHTMPGPLSPQGRIITRDGDDCYRVYVQGRTSVFHFTVRVLQVAQIRAR